MVSKLALKRHLKLILATAGLLITLGMVNTISGLFQYFQSGANPASVFVTIPLLPAGETASLRWIPSPPHAGRAFDTTTRQLITGDYARAWNELQSAIASGHIAGLADTFTGPALRQAIAAVHDARAGHGATRMIDLSHVLQMRMFSADGTLASLRDQAEVVRSTPLGGIDDITDAHERYDVILALQDGNWHIRQLVRERVRVWTPSTPLAPARHVVRTPLTGLNYYPRTAPWEKFLTVFPVDAIRHDLGVIHALGVSTVRIFVPFDAVGGGHTHQTVGHLQSFLAMAHQQHLGVIVTLFDGRSDHALPFWGGDETYLRAIVPALAGRPGLVAWDLKNEPDLDYGNPAPQRLVNAWLAFVAAKVRALDHRTPLTIGWSSAAAAQASPLPLDFVSFHDYLSPTGALARFAAVRRAAHGRPVVLEEFGLSTYGGLLAPDHSEADQAWYYAQILRAARRAGLDGWLAWTLNDFTSGPPGVIAPWVTHPQESFGLVRPNGTLTPAAALLAPHADLSAVRAPGLAERLLTPFTMAEVGLALLTLAALALWWRLRSRRKRRRRGGPPSDGGRGVSSRLGRAARLPRIPRLPRPRPGQALKAIGVRIARSLDVGRALAMLPALRPLRPRPRPRRAVVRGYAAVPGSVLTSGARRRRRHRRPRRL